MTRRRHRDERRDRARAEVKSGATAAGIATSLAHERPDQLRPWLLAGATALLVARPLVTSDGGPWMGDGQPFAALWIILAVLWTLGALGRPRLTVQFTWTDATVLAFFTWWTWSAWHGAETGAPRPSFNMLWEGASTLVAFFLLRQLAPAGREARTLVVAMITVGVLLAGSAFHEYVVTMPQDRADFTANPAAMLRKNGIEPMAPDSAEFKAFKARLDSPEPLATFSLTNSLAAYLAPWLILTLGIAVRGTKDQEGRKRILLAAICAVPIAGALMLTHSRSAWIGAAVGAMLVWLMTRAGRLGFGWKRWGIMAALIAAPAIVIEALAVLQPEILEPAIRSFRFRLEYWQSTLAMIRDHPWLGCGPGNFGDYYTLYKLPVAGEEIKDPHNFLFEVAANAGLPALIALGAVLVGLALRVFRRPTVDPANRPADSEADAVRWILGGALLGVCLAMVLNLILGFPVRGEEMFAGVLLGAAATAIFYPWISQGILPPSLLAVGAVVLLVALLAVGGMTFGGVAGTLWLLLALALNATDRPGATHSLPWKATLLLFAAAIALTVAQHQTGYEPVLTCNTALEAARSARFERKEEEYAKKLLVATAADPWSIEPCRQLSRLRLEQWQRSGEPAVRDDSKLNEFKTCLNHVLMFDAHSSAAWLEAGTEWLGVFQDLPSQTGYAHLAVGYLQKATELYPNSASIRARLAAALEASGQFETAQATAREALRLDDLMPHEDKKLAADLCPQTKRIAAGEKLPVKPPAAAPQTAK